MKHSICLIVFLAGTISVPSAHAGLQEIRSCDFEMKARCASGDARVTLADGVVKRIEVDVFWCGLPGRPGYSCTIDSSSDDGESAWSDEAGATVVTNKSPFSPNEPDRVKVTVGKHVSINLEETQSLGRCGAGAELPQAIVIPAQKGKCRIWLKSPQ